MICPLMSNRSGGIAGLGMNKECEEDKCALWDKPDKVCCFLAIKMELVRIQEK